MFDVVAWKGMPRTTPAEREHLGKVRGLPCCICNAGTQRTPTEAHHITQGSRRLGHLYCIPLCHECHDNVHVYADNMRSLWQQTVDILGVVVSWPQSKICPRRA